MGPPGSPQPLPHSCFEAPRRDQFQAGGSLKPRQTVHSAGHVVACGVPRNSPTGLEEGGRRFKVARRVRLGLGCWNGSSQAHRVWLVDISILKPPACCRGSGSSDLLLRGLRDSSGSGEGSRPWLSLEHWGNPGKEECQNNCPMGLFDMGGSPKKNPRFKGAEGLMRSRGV